MFRRASLNNDGSDPKPIKMRDTCCLENTLSFDGNSSTETSALTRGVGMEVTSVPLHKMNSKSDLVTGEVMVGIRPELPVAGVSMLLGNDLAGGKVLPELVGSNRPGLETSDDTDIFPACVVTRSMSKLASEEESEEWGTIREFGILAQTHFSK